MTQCLVFILMVRLNFVAHKMVLVSLFQKQAILSESQKCVMVNHVVDQGHGILIKSSNQLTITTNQDKNTVYVKTGVRMGHVETVLFFENGKYVEERQYYTNGNIRHFNKYKNGVFWESYAWSPNGKPLEIIHNGTGKGTNYSEDGKTRYLREFKDGKEISCSIIPTED